MTKGFNFNDLVKNCCGSFWLRIKLMFVKYMIKIKIKSMVMNLKVVLKYGLMLIHIRMLCFFVLLDQS